jgi:hypothetical protein
MIVPFVNVCKYKKLEIRSQGKCWAQHYVFFNPSKCSELFRTILGAGGAGQGGRNKKGIVLICSELFWLLVGRGQEKKRDDKFKILPNYTGCRGGGDRITEKKTKKSNFPGCRRGGVWRKGKERNNSYFSELFWVPAGRGQ